MLFENAHLSMEVPDDWVDRTVASWTEAAPNDTYPAVLTLTRDVAGVTDTLENRLVSTVRSLVTLPELRIHERNRFTLQDDTPAAQVLIEWTHPRSGKTTELVTLFLRRGVVWTFTAAIPTARIDELDPLVQKILASFTVV